MTLDPQARTLLDQLAAADTPPLEEQSVDEARQALAMLASLSPGEEVASVADQTGPGELPVRVYIPAQATGAVLVWFHGGGWVIGDLETADAACRGLANRSGATVVSVDYRRAPEHPAPTPFDDCLAATRWVAAPGAELGVDPSRLAVGGDSAGGNLAALVALAARDGGGPAIGFQLLVYPATDLTMSHPSIIENGEGHLLTAAAMGWFADHYLGDGDPTDPAVSPLHVGDLAGLPPAMVITAGYDPLRDEGDAYAERLSAAGVATEHVRYDGMIHGFFGLDALLDRSREAVTRAGAALRAALA